MQTWCVERQNRHIISPRRTLRYSMVAEWLISQAFKEIENIEKYSALEEKYRRELEGFLNLKRGKPVEKTDIMKTKITFYFGESVVKYIYRTHRRFPLSVSSACEILLRIGLARENVH